MTSLRMLVTAFAVALFSAAPLAAHATLASNAGPATTWHVAPGGNDTAGGGPDAPLSTIDEAFDRALPGDTILLLAGQLPNAILEAKSGTAQAPITVVGSTGAVIGASPGQPALALHDTAHIALVNVHVDAGSAGVELIEAHSVSIDGLVASDTNGHAISIADSNDVRLEDCRVIDSAGDGIHATDSSSLLLDRCRFSS
ncbi:MAG: right-handed parallel beta-helix repeat-containing protein, partial [Acidobacteria bacterium]|nr:right-handed parallel beta-helix repeat-containing protein [Acidobacteriota bacterium]